MAVETTAAQSQRMEVRQDLNQPTQESPQGVKTAREPRYDANGPLIVWIDYDYEGWRPVSVDTVAEAIAFATSGYSSSPAVLTRLLTLIEAPNQENP